MAGLTEKQQAEYEENGYTTVPGLLSAAECDRFIEHMLDLQAGRKALDGFAPRQSHELGRTHNQHLYDKMAEEYLILPQLRAPLHDCLGDDPEGIQTMYFWVGSEQRRHQDQYYLSGCMSAWLAFQDVSVENGTIWVQPGSHRQRLVTRDDFAEGKEFEGWDYNDAVDEQFRRNDLPEYPVIAMKGDVVFFNGVLIHRGGEIGQRGSYRHVLANHYIGYGFDGWNHRGWQRFDFDGNRRQHP